MLASERIWAAKAFLNTIPPGDWTTEPGDAVGRHEIFARLPGEGDRVGETLGALFGAVGATLAVSGVSSRRASVPWAPSRPVGGAAGRLSNGREPGGPAGVGGERSRRRGGLLWELPQSRAGTPGHLPTAGLLWRGPPCTDSGLPAFAQALDAAEADQELRIYPGVDHA